MAVVIGWVHMLKPLDGLTVQFREQIIKMLCEAKSGHPGGSLSAVDLLTVLWFKEMRGVESASNLQKDRDHFILSKGHGVPALYVILAEKGFISTEELSTLRKIESRLQGHPDRQRLPIVEASTGSLGQGMSVAQGMALAFKRDQSSARVYCLVGDGEIQEGQIWECALSAPKFGLSNLCVILDANGGQIDGFTREVMPLEPLAEKWKAFGWHVIEIDGHNLGAIQKAYEEARALGKAGGHQPTFIIARTIKGKGVSFMENKIEWHGVAPKPEERDRAIAELEKGSKHV